MLNDRSVDIFNIFIRLQRKVIYGPFVPFFTLSVFENLNFNNMLRYIITTYINTIAH